jgi:hypothetical protein
MADKPKSQDVEYTNWFAVDGAYWSAPRHMVRAQGFDATLVNFYEAPSTNPNEVEAWCYTDHITYEPGDEVAFHISSTARTLTIEVSREALERTVVYRSEIKPQRYETPEDFYAKGCGWPVAHRWKIPEDARSGFYMVLTRGVGAKGEIREHEHGFVVRAKKGAKRPPILFLLPTSTYLAYSNWGGTNQYMGLYPETGTGSAPIISVQKPWAKGFVYLPEGAPRKINEQEMPPGAIPRYSLLEFAFARGYSRFYGSSGWAYYDRHFANWAERDGFAFDYATQVDLHYRPELLDGYKCVVVVGHDEYWSREMRDAIDAYVERGGHFARFAGNFGWQIRLEDEGRTHVCYKESAHTHDPVRNSTDKSRLTSSWEDPTVGHPGVKTVGLNTIPGIYANIGALAGRHSGGFTVYRPQHWALEGTGLCYGDDFGSKAAIFGYEVDGLNYEIRLGLPHPIGWVPEGHEIIAMGLASNFEDARGIKGAVRYYGNMGDPYFKAVAPIRFGGKSDELADAVKRGAGMIVAFKRGKGEVFCAGTCEWVYGLKLHDPFVEMITKNVLKRFTA